MVRPCVFYCVKPPWLISAPPPHSLCRSHSKAQLAAGSHALDGCTALPLGDNFTSDGRLCTRAIRIEVKSDGIPLVKL
jgi:hypothetical protein